jgi:uncharacterized damage-inducible protein DinB
VSDDRKIIEKAVSHALRGKGAHVEGQNIFAGLDWKLAGVRPVGVPHSLFQLLNHLTFWQDWAVKWLDGHAPATPRHASGSWPGDCGPADRKEWERAVHDFQNGLDELDRRCGQADILSKPGQKSRLEMLHTIASHNSYHAGQVVLLRQILGAWPPPSGGLTW